MTQSLDSSITAGLLDRVGRANREIEARYPIESGKRQPVHTVYGGGQLFKADLAAKLGQLALRALEEYGGDPVELMRAVGLEVPEAMARTITARVVEKLGREPVEDFRIDFEDGYGNRPDGEEDGHVVAAAGQVAEGVKQRSLPPYIGIRIKSLTSDELARRSLRSLDLFVTAAVKAGGLPEGFIVTVPKITHVEQLSAVVAAFEALEQKLGLPKGRLVLEMMVETTQSIFDHEGRVALPRYLEAARGRCVGAHFGTYDYTAACNITAAHQRMGHPACDFAKDVMQVSFAGRGIFLSDGATTTMPVPVHRAGPGQALTAAQLDENRRQVHAAWRLHASDVRHSLVTGFYQGWDLHPAQLVTRYATVFAFFLEGLEAASVRLKNFVGKAAQATLVGDVFDDAATGQGLLNYFLRGINCGALSEDEALACGLTVEELRGRSFLAILKNRRKVGYDVGEEPQRGAAYRIEAGRLVLRPWRPADAGLIDDAIKDGVAELARFVPRFAREPLPPADRVVQLRQWRGRFDLGLDFSYGVFDLGETIAYGGVGLHPRVGPGSMELGYWVRAGAVRQGIATAAAGALAVVALAAGGLDWLEIHCNPDNLASAAVARKLGFHHDGTLRGRLIEADGTRRDAMVWTMLAGELLGSPLAAIELTAFDALGEAMFVHPAANGAIAGPGGPDGAQPR